MLKIVKAVNNFYPDKILHAPNTSLGFHFIVDGQLVGLITPKFAKQLKKYDKIFKFKDHLIILNKALKTIEERTIQIENVLLELKLNNINEYECLNGWRNERFACYGESSESNAHGGKILLSIERSGCGFFGIRQSGCHLNGYIWDNETLKMWVGRRSKTKQTYPGFLDNLVGGGLGSGSNPVDTIKKEAGEEAGIYEKHLLDKIRPGGAISFYMDHPKRGWMPDTEYIYDLELPKSYIPRPVDGEVEEFFLMTVEEIKSRLNEFTLEAAICVIDFLIRKGIVNSSNEADYTEIVMGIHRNLPFPNPKFYHSDIC